MSRARNGPLLAARGCDPVGRTPRCHRLPLLCCYRIGGGKESMKNRDLAGSSCSDHPAMVAWRAIGTEDRPATSIDTLQDETYRQVWRLHGVGPSRESLVAKRCRRREAIREREIYARILPRLPISQVRYHGYLEDGDGERAWLFIEDLGEDTPYSPTSARDREAAAAWLGMLHSSGDLVPGADRRMLGECGPERFREHLDWIVAGIPRLRSNAALSPPDSALLDDLHRQCATVASRWPELVAFYDSMPKGVVHGDFSEAHIFFSEHDGRRHIRLIDWSDGGWGAPALDVAKFLGYRVSPDIDAYLDAVRRNWIGIDRAEIWRLGYVGEVFRSLASVRWKVASVEWKVEGAAPRWIEGPMSTLSVYRDWMEEILEAAPWSDDPRLGSKTLPRPKSWT